MASPRYSIIIVDWEEDGLFNGYGMGRFPRHSREQKGTKLVCSGVSAMKLYFGDSRRDRIV